MIGEVVILNDVEQRICKHVAKRRFENNRSNGVKNSKIGDQSDYKTDLEGFAAEVAFCKLFNIFPDFTIEPRSTDDDFGDALLHNKKIDIKTTEYKTGRLLAANWKNSDIDAYALMIGKFPEYTFRGFMKKNDLIQKDRLGNLGYGETYIAHQNELVEFEDLTF